MAEILGGTVPRSSNSRDEFPQPRSWRETSSADNFKFEPSDRRLLCTALNSISNYRGEISKYFKSYSVFDSTVEI
jgi:hypothetical protein